MPAPDRIPLHRSIAVVREDSIVVRPARGRLVGPLLQAAMAGGAVALIVALLDRLPLLLLSALLLAALILGPVAVLGLVHNVAGSSFTIDRRKQSAVLQQGFLGLGLGTAELVPFWRIDRVEVVGGRNERPDGGGVPEVLQWDVELVKDNGKRLRVGTVVAADLFEGDAVERANRLARAVAGLSGTRAVTADVPEAPLNPAATADERRPVTPTRARRRRGRRRGRRPPPGAVAARTSGAQGTGERGMDRATEHATDGAVDDAVELMREAKTIAVVGVSSRADRDSHRIARYLIDAGYTVYLVNPREREVLGRRVYDSVSELPEPVDIVDVFRRAEHVPPVVEDAIAAGAKAVWMQLGIVNEQAAARARAAGLHVVMDRCTKVEHQRILDQARPRAGRTAGP